jgi:hypothetical protein
MEPSARSTELAAITLHIRKYRPEYSRRLFLERLGAGVLACGVLRPLAAAIASDGDVASAYPDELLSLDQYTAGRIAAGGRIDAGNVDAVRELLDPVRFHQVKNMGRVMEVVETTTDMERLTPRAYLEATLRHRGRARFSASGNVVTDDGRPWIGGNPFPEPRNGLEIFANITLSWGRHDVSFYPVRETDIDADGHVAYTYDLVWAELAPVGRVTLEPQPYWPGHEDKLRYQSLFFVAPHDIRGTSYLNVWPYDQRQLPELWGYLPEFKRVRRLPTNQRFEPLVPGGTLYLSDAWSAGDPLLTWGNYRVVHQGPFLAGLSGNWNSAHPDWVQGTHGGPDGVTFWDTRVELVPEAIVVDAEPVAFPRAPVSRKRVWFDARTQLPLAMVTYDRRGQPFKSFDGTYSLYAQDGHRVADGADAYWSWCNVHAHDVQTGRMSRLQQVRVVAGGHVMRVNDPSVYDDFLTVAALRRLGH